MDKMNCEVVLSSFSLAAEDESTELYLKDIVIIFLQNDSVSHKSIKL